MAAFTFETISAADALAFTSADTLTFTTPGATASAVTVAITAATGFPTNTPATVALTFGGVTKTFSAALQGKGAVTGQIILPDASMLFVGTTGADTVTGSAQGDGIYGGGTQGIVQQYQQRNGLPATGTADAATLERLGVTQVVPIANNPGQTTPAPPPPGNTAPAPTDPATPAPTTKPNKATSERSTGHDDEAGSSSRRNRAINVGGTANNRVTDAPWRSANVSRFELPLLTAQVSQGSRCRSDRVVA